MELIEGGHQTQQILCAHVRRWYDLQAIFDHFFTVKWSKCVTDVIGQTLYNLF